MKISEINKLLMGLNVFPDLISNVDITRITDEVMPEKSINAIKSPRGGNAEQEKKNDSIEYADFEKILFLIAVKAFNSDESPVCIFI